MRVADAAVVVVVVAAAACVQGMPGLHSLSPGFHASQDSKDSKDSGNTMLGDIIQEFGLDVSVELQQRPAANVVISPLSISALLSVLMMGAAGTSHRQLRRGLGFPDTLAENHIHASFQRLTEAISANGPELTLNVANGLFLQRGAGIIYEFAQKAHAHYNCVASTLDFRNASVASTTTINQWVKESTSGMIPQLFRDPLDTMTTFVAVNTVFFNGKWATPFTPSTTTEQDFDTGAGKIKVPLMSGTVSVRYVNMPHLDAHMAALPYQGDRQAMYIIVPKGPGPVSTDDLDDLELELSANTLNALIGNMTSLDMRVWLPRMRLTFRTSLKEALAGLHMGAIFNPATADFSRLTSLPVWVDDVLHETVIEVTEEGTKAAAGTGSGLNRIGSSLNSFIVNRPAIFFIRDEESGVPLFWGKLVRPEAFRR